MVKDLLVCKEELEVLELLASVLDFVGGTVESLSVFVLASRLVVGEHSVAVFHREDLIVDATVVTVLIPQVVELLAQLGNQLVLLTASDLNARASHASLQESSRLCALTDFLFDIV